MASTSSNVSGADHQVSDSSAAPSEGPSRQVSLSPEVVSSSSSSPPEAGSGGEIQSSGQVSGDQAQGGSVPTTPRTLEAVLEEVSPAIPPLLEVAPAFC